MTNTERLIIWPIGIALLAMAGAAYLAWCGAVSVASFWDWVWRDE